VDVALRDLDGPLLAARWARAVLAQDPALVAACEQEASVRGFTAAGLVAATKKKKEPSFKADIKPTGKSYQTLANEAKANRDAGNPGGMKRGKTKPENVGKGKFRKKSGAGGGGQFTSADDPEAIAEGEIVAGHKEQQSLSDERAKVRERRSGEDEQQRQQHYADDQTDREADQANRDADEQDRAAADARKATRDARKAMEAAEDQDIDDRVRANDTYQRTAQGQIALMQRQLSEARQVGHTDDENKLLDQIKEANTALEQARADRAALEQERTSKKTDRATSRVVDATTEAEARAKAAADKRARDNAKRTRDETKRSTRESERRAIREARAAEDAALAAKSAELRDRIEEARQRKRDAAAARKAEAKAKKEAKAAARGRKASGMVAAFGRFSEDLHPRGKDGKWIELHGLVDVFGLSGFQHGQRGNKHVQGEVTEIIPNPKDPGNPVVRVKMTDPRWSPDKFGPTVDVDRHQIQARVKPKATLTPTAPKTGTPTAVPAVKPSIAPAKPGVTVIPPRTPTPAMTPHPDGPGFAPLNPPSEWATMTQPEQLAWITDLMHADFTKWREQETGFDFTGFDSGIALNTANTYRDLANWDPQTARRIDNPIMSTGGLGQGLNSNAIAVAHPGTEHPGGIGEKTGPASMVFGAKYMSGMKFWKQQQEASGGKDIPWSMSSQYGDPMLTVTHEFSHQRQFRFLDMAMRDANKPFATAVRDDGFGMVPDSSNWAETQALRYDIQKLAPTKYGKSKSSEAFAESWTAKMTGDSSPELDNALEQWDMYMGLVEHLPTDRHWDATPFDQLSAAEQDQFWKDNGKYLDLPGMAEHYPDSAAAYSAWQAGTEAPEATTPFGHGYSTPAADWTEDAPAAMRTAPVTDPAQLDDLYTRLNANRAQARRLRLTYPAGIGDPQAQTPRVRPPGAQAELDRLDAEYADLRSQYHPPVDYTGPVVTPAAPGDVVEGPNGTQWEATANANGVELTYDHPSGTRLYVDSGPNGVKWSIHEEGHDEPLKAGMARTEAAAMDDALWYANLDTGPAEMQPVDYGEAPERPFSLSEMPISPNGQGAGGMVGAGIDFYNQYRGAKEIVDNLGDAGPAMREQLKAVDIRLLPKTVHTALDLRGPNVPISGRTAMQFMAAIAHAAAADDVGIINTAVANVMAKGRSDEEISDQLTKLGYTPELGLVTTMQNGWNESSRSAFGYAMQGLVGGKAPRQLRRISDVGGAAALTEQIGDPMRTVMDTQARMTQDFLRLNGLTSLTVHRGVNIDVSKREVIANPLSSWALDPGIANRFGMTVYSTSLPAERIFAVPEATGFGYSTLGEIVVYGGKV